MATFMHETRQHRSSKGSIPPRGAGDQLALYRRRALDGKVGLEFLENSGKMIITNGCELFGTSSQGR